MLYNAEKYNIQHIILKTKAKQTGYLKILIYQFFELRSKPDAQYSTLKIYV